MKTIKILTFILIGIIVASLIWAATLPSSFAIKETIEINAPIGKVFTQVNNVRNWSYWSPWADSLFNTKYEGKSKGVGAKMLWSDEKEGEGVQTILESKENSRIVTELSFSNGKKPAKATFTFTDLPEGTEVTWTMQGEDLSYPFGRFIGLIIQKGASKNFAIGLQQLKEHTESIKDQPDYLGYEIYDEIMDEQHFIAIVDSGKMEDLKILFSKNYSNIYKKFAELKKQPTGSPIAEWRSYNPKATSTFACLVPLAGRIEIKDAAISYYHFDKRRTIWLTHKGAYETSYNAWNTLDKYIKYNKLQTIGNPYEVYVSGPMNEADTSKWITNICFPVAN